MNQVWRRFSCNRRELNLGTVLQCGQSFRWNKSTECPEIWLGVLGKRLWFLRQHQSGDIEYKTIPEFPDTQLQQTGLSNIIELVDGKSKNLEAPSMIPSLSTTITKLDNKNVAENVKLGRQCSKTKSNVRKENNINNTESSISSKPTESPKLSSLDGNEILKDYFQMSVPVTSLYDEWSKNDLFFKELESPFHGIRILRQDPVENLFSFICSQNNNISRISQLVEKLCENYGELVTRYEGTDYYSFPTIEALATRKGDVLETELRQLGFGYRAKFIQRVADTIHNKPDSVQWLFDLRQQSYKDAHSALCSLYGVGPKVADCVCLMSLDKHDAIPVDTHMWQIAAREYLPHLKKLKNISDKAYKEIGDFFRQQFGEYAGWAQSVLFSSDLKKFESMKTVSKKKAGNKRTVPKETKHLNKKNTASTAKRKK